MDSQDTPDLSDRQKEVLARLPASGEDLAASIGISASTIKDHVSRLRDKGVGVAYDGDAGQYYLSDAREEKLRRISTQHKGTKTRRANELIEAEERTLLRRLERTEPLTTPAREPEGAESVVAVLSDLHFGDLVEAEGGGVLYDTDTAEELVELFGEKLLHIAELESEYTRLGDCHLCLLGDIATGEGIYEGQVHDIESHLAEQVTRSVQALHGLCVTLADSFETLHVHAILGNHGKIRASGVSKQANTDLITYRWLDDGLRRSDVDNVSVEIAESTHHLNTEIRDWRFHLRHGQDGQKHVDKTARSEADWRGWREAHAYDVALRGHYHNPSVDYVLNRFPVLTAPSPKPGSEFIERIGSPDVSERRHLGWVFGVGDHRPITFLRLLDDR